MQTIEELRERYLELIAEQEEWHRVPEGAEVATFAVDPVQPPSRTSLRIRITDLFRLQPELMTVVLTTGEVPFGVVHRETVRPDEPGSSRETNAAVPSVGPPTRSSPARYYVCTHAQCQQCGKDVPCTALEILLFGDGWPPPCPHGHGPMVEEE